MKTLFVALFVSVTAFGAETNVVKVLTTNYVAAASNLREVDGQLYNIQLSQKWETIHCKYQNQEGDFAVFQKIDRVITGRRSVSQNNGDLSSSGGIGSFTALISARAEATIDHNIYQDKDGAFILLKNFPTGNFVTGQELAPRLLRVSQTNYNGGIVAIYDCGKPHMVPVVTSKTIKTDSISGAK